MGKVYFDFMSGSVEKMLVFLYYACKFLGSTVCSHIFGFWKCCCVEIFAAFLHFVSVYPFAGKVVALYSRFDVIVSTFVLDL